MKRAGNILIWVVRIFFLLIAIWQILGLLPVLTWFSNPSGVPVGMWMAVATKLLIMFVCFGVFWGLGKLSKRLISPGTSSREIARAMNRSAGEYLTIPLIVVVFLMFSLILVTCMT